MAIIKFLNNTVSLKKSVTYIAQKGKTNDKLVDAIDCVLENAYEEMIAVKKQFNKKDKGRDKIHFVQSFSPKDNVTFEQAHEIGMKLAEFYKGFQMVVATHIDREHIHTHFVLNTVNFETGKKFNQSKYDLARLKRYSNKLCKEYGLSTIRVKAKVDDIKINEYKSRQKGESWKMQLEKDIDKCMNIANNKLEFFKEMNKLGYKVTWTKERKNITFTTPQGKKCRDRKLHNEKYLKENMEKYFRNKVILQKAKIKSFEKETKYYSNKITKTLMLLFEEKQNEYIEAIYKTHIDYGNNAKKEYARKMSYSSEEIEI